MPDHAVADLCGEANQRAAERRDPDRNICADRRWRRLELGEIVRVILAVEPLKIARVCLRVHQPDDLDHLAQVLQRLAVGHAEEALAPRPNTRAETEHEAAAADPVQVHRRHRRLERAPHERQRNSGR